MTPSGIAWPQGPFQAEGLPAYRLTAAWFLIVMAVAITLGMLSLLWVTVPGRQLVRDTAFSMGLGVTDPEAVVTGVSCSEESTSGRPRMVWHECDVDIALGTRKRRVMLEANSDLGTADILGVGRAVGGMAVRMRFWTLSGRWFLWRWPALIVIGMLWLARWAWRLIARDRGLHEAAAQGTIQEVDLLRRRQRGYRANVHYVWDFAFESAGVRRYGSTAVVANPLMLDGIVTRGAALVGAKGDAWLLQYGLYPLRLDPQTVQGLTEQIHARAYVARPPLTHAMEEAIAATPQEGAQRAYLVAFRNSWVGWTDEAANQGVEERHAAAKDLTLTELDQLLQTARQAIPKGWG